MHSGHRRALVSMMALSMEKVSLGRPVCVQRVAYICVYMCMYLCVCVSIYVCAYSRMCVYVYF